MEITKGVFIKFQVMSPYRGREDVEMNVCAEGMFMLGRDGNLYIDYTCGGDYKKYSRYKL